ncbi:MAG: Mov34/MPN/PAD-1 family protein [Alicyclobacillus sp.]|nr:Mov34/MPN/PAD-1 family protein [Alicyclobacillus sp.]
MSISPPAWWTEALGATCIRAAEEALPNEMCGFIWTDPRGVQQFTKLRAVATPTSVQAVPQDVVARMYEVDRQDGRILASVHTHPLGPSWFSQRDQSLALVATWHVLVYRQVDGWAVRFGRSEAVRERRTGVKPPTGP